MNWLKSMVTAPVTLAQVFRMFIRTMLALNLSLVDAWSSLVLAML